MPWLHHTSTRDAELLPLSAARGDTYAVWQFQRNTKMVCGLVGMLGFSCALNTWYDILLIIADTCVRGPPAPAADFLEGGYHTVTWAKWSVLWWALRGADAALFVDADVILLRNPFAERTLFLAHHEQMLYQGEDLCSPFSPLAVRSTQVECA